MLAFKYIKKAKKKRKENPQSLHPFQLASELDLDLFPPPSSSSFSTVLPLFFIISTPSIFCISDTEQLRFGVFSFFCLDWQLPLGESTEAGLRTLGGGMVLSLLGMGASGALCGVRRVLLRR
jgi:hypothetical protein